MPPIRSISATKPIKTERTHEENQERAYIAASRRSDRSLEARIESARRASEIHKRRTGRSLRVTEADVVNEEMYEEEDDDLPMQYRRLTAHLNGNASDFNRRLAAYLTNQVAMRSALDQAITNSYAPSGQQWDPTTQTLQPTQQQWMQNQQHTAQKQFPGPMGPPQFAQRSPTSYRQSPYPIASAGGYRPEAFHRPSPINTAHHHSSTSMSQSGLPSPAVSPHNDGTQSPNPAYPKSAPPADGTSSPWHSHHQRRSNSDTSLAQLAAAPQLPERSTASVPQPQPTSEESRSTPSLRTAMPVTSQSTPWSAPPQTTSFSPMQQFNGMSTALPNEAQMFLGPDFNINEFNGRPASMHEKPMQQPFYSYNPNGFNKPRQSMFEGMNQTLAPNAFEQKYDQNAMMTPQSALMDSSDMMFSPSLNYGMDPMFNFGEDSMSQMFMPSEGTTTPDQDLSVWIDPTAWEEPTVV